MDLSDQRPVIIRLVFACPFSVLKGIDLLKCCRADTVGSGLKGANFAAEESQGNDVA